MSYTDWKYTKGGIAARLKLAKERLKPWAAKGVKHAAVQGTSGIWLAPGLISAGYKVLLVRKPGEGSHGFQVEPYQDICGNSYPVVIVDDFVSSGQTVRRMVESLTNNSPHHVVGIVIHDPSCIDMDVHLDTGSGFSRGWQRPERQCALIGGDAGLYRPQEPLEVRDATQVSPKP